MISFELLTSLAEWTGWLPISILLLVIIPIIIFFKNEQLKIERVKEEALLMKYDVLIERNKVLENTTPDLLAKRLMEQIKDYQTGIKLLDEDMDKRDQEIVLLKKNLEEKIEEARTFKGQLEEAQNSLVQLGEVLPREGRVDNKLLSVIMAEINYSNKLIISIEKSRNFVEENFDLPVRIMCVYPGMHKTILSLVDNNEKQIGRVLNRYPGFYDRDYFETLLFVLKLNNDNPYFPDDGSGNPEFIQIGQFLIESSTSNADNNCFGIFPFINIPLVQ